ncbi:MAG TPA: hypothetical protein VFF06_14935 [Polyangia bacterium]|nr:hypothetical protein [Polyangia bacterium]
MSQADVNVSRMPTIVIRIDPEKLEDADLDLRYEIPELLTQRSQGLLSDAGYTHEWDSDALLLFLETKDVTGGLPFVIALLENDRLHGNDLAAAAMIASSEREVTDVEQLEVVYPPNAGALIQVVPGSEPRAFSTRTKGR